MKTILKQTISDVLLLQIIMIPMLLIKLAIDLIQTGQLDWVNEGSRFVELIISEAFSFFLLETIQYFITKHRDKRKS